MDPGNEQPSDYYLLPRIGIDLGLLTLHGNNGAQIDTFRFETLDYNELGVLVRPVSPEAERGIRVGERVAGTIGSDPNQRVRYQGEVIRMQDEGLGPCYAIRFDGPPKKPEEAGSSG